MYNSIVWCPRFAAPVDPNAGVRNAWERANLEYKAAGCNLKRNAIQLELADLLWGTKRRRRS